MNKALKQFVLIVFVLFGSNSLNAMAKAMAAEKAEPQEAIKRLSNFYWINEGDKESLWMGGMAVPRTKEAPKALRELNIGVIINLMGEEYQHVAEYKKQGVDIYHLFVKNHQPPTIEQVYEFIAKADEYMAQGKNVAVHCLGGKGRTGTMIACWLIAKKGFTAQAAISEVRKHRPDSIETASQVKFIKDFKKDYDLR